MKFWTYTIVDHEDLSKSPEFFDIWVPHKVFKKRDQALLSLLGDCNDELEAMGVEATLFEEDLKWEDKHQPTHKMWVSTPDHLRNTVYLWEVEVVD